MGGGEAVHSLDLHDHLPLHNEVEAVPAIQTDLAVGRRQAPLSFHAQTPLSQLEGETALVGGFEETGPKRTMELNRGFDDPIREPIKVPSFALLRVLCGLSGWRAPGE